MDLIGASEDIEIVQIDVERPDKNIMNQFIQREKSAATNIINAATDLRGQNRDKILSMIESTHHRAYEDVLGSLSVILNSKVEIMIDLEIRYFLEDARIKWEPSVQITLNYETGETTLEGFILVMNNSDFAYPQCEPEFAEFELEHPISDEGYLPALEAQQNAQNIIPASSMMPNLKRMKSILK